MISSSLRFSLRYDLVRLDGSIQYLLVNAW